MILRPVRPAVAHGAADDEAAGGVDVVLGLAVDEVAGSTGLMTSRARLCARSFVGDVSGAAGRDDHGVDAHGLAVDVLDRDLALAVGAQPVEHARLRASASAAELVRERDGQRHELGVSSQAKPNIRPWSPAPCSLWRPSPSFTPWRCRGLLVDGDEDGAGVGVEAHLRAGVADVADRACARCRVVDHGAGGDLAGDDDEAGLDHGLAGDAAAGSCARIASRMASEIWSQILSGWPSVTDSEVNRWLAMGGRGYTEATRGVNAGAVSAATSRAGRGAPVR
jgi:hypothetical protein